jgi:germination protein M
MNKKRMYLIIILSMFVFMISACRDKPQKQETEYFFYFVNKEETELKKVTFTPQADETDTEAMVEEFIQKLSEEPEKEGWEKVKPNEVSVLPIKPNQTRVKDKQLTLNFSKQYKDMNNVTEVLFRSSVVEMFLQIPEIEYVAFSVEGEPLKENPMDDRSPEMGRMTKNSFINNTGSNVNSYTSNTLSIYFANETGDKLVKQNINVHYFSNIPLEKIVMEQLIKGPSKEDLSSSIPKSTKLLGVSIKDGICYVNLSKEFLDLSIDVADEVPVYAIVNSISDTCNVSKVQISVEGNTDVVFRDKIPLDGILERNLDLIQTPETSWEQQSSDLPEESMDKTDSRGVEDVIGSKAKETGGE